MTVAERLDWREITPGTFWADVPGGRAARVVVMRRAHTLRYEWAVLEWRETCDGGHYATIDAGTSTSIEQAKRRAREIACDTGAGAVTVEQPEAAPARRRSRRGLRWTPAEVETLRRAWHEVGQRTLRAKLGRPWRGIVHKAADLGLPTGVPQGCLGIAAAADRCGYEIRTLEAILAWAAVRVRHRYTGPSYVPTRGWHRRYVDADECAAAVARWLAHETVNGAARARGLVEMTLRRWLAEAGVIAPQDRRRARRIPSATIDRVVAARAPAQRRAKRGAP